MVSEGHRAVLASRNFRRSRRLLPCAEVLDGRGETPGHGNPKALRAGGFASGEKRLGVQATLTHCRPLEAHLSRAVSQQGMEARLRFFSIF